MQHEIGNERVGKFSGRETKSRRRLGGKLRGLKLRELQRHFKSFHATRRYPRIGGHSSQKKVEGLAGVIIRPSKLSCSWPRQEGRSKSAQQSRGLAQGDGMQPFRIRHIDQCAWQATGESR